MNVTGITVQVRNAERYSVYVDGRYSFSLSAGALLQSGLVHGQELSQVELTAYKKLSQDDKAYGLALAYVARRLRSEGELRDYCARKQYAPGLTADIIARLYGAGLVDDVKFARRWVENRRLLKATSTKRLRLELQKKKVADTIIQAVLAEDETDERQVLRELVAKKRKQSRYQDPRKLIAYLAYQGFSYDDIKVALNEEE